MPQENRVLAHGQVPICTHQVAVHVLRAGSGRGTRVVLAAGAESGTQLPRRAAEAVAAQLGSSLVELPGDHVSRVASMGGDPAGFASRLREVLDA